MNEKIALESSDYVEGFAQSLGVDIELIPTPAPYKVKRHAELYMYVLVAQKKASFSNAKEIDKDAYYMKYQLYKTLLEQLELTLTKDTYSTGITTNKRKFPSSIRMYRG